MSRKDYIAIAKIISAEKGNARAPETRGAVERIQREIADAFKRDNAAFDYARFNAACEV